METVGLCTALHDKDMFNFNDQVYMYKLVLILVGIIKIIAFRKIKFLYIIDSKN
jgi:hypothetical protein